MILWDRMCLFDLFEKKFCPMPKQPTQSLRTRKLQPEFRRRRGGDVAVPSLHLSGVWLEKLGFAIGDTVEITEREGLLVIRPYRATSSEVAAQALQLSAELKKVKHILRELA